MVCQSHLFEEPTLCYTDALNSSLDCNFGNFISHMYYFYPPLELKFGIFAFLRLEICQ